MQVIFRLKKKFSRYYLGQYEYAVRDFTQAIALNPKYEKAYDGRGRSYERLGQSQNARDDFRKAEMLKK